MFSRSSNYLILVKKNKLEVFFNETSKELIYPLNLVQNLEILDMVNFEKSISQFLKELGLKKEKVLIILSEELLFLKTFPSVSAEQVDGMVKDFVESVPFSPHKVSYKKIVKESELTLISTNKDFYVSVTKALEDVGLEVLAVVPITVFKDQLGFNDDSLDINEAKKILSGKNLIKTADFLSDEDGKIKESMLHTSFSAVYLVIFGILLIGAVSVLGGIAFGLIPNPLTFFNSQSSKKNIEQIKTTVASPSAQVEEATNSSNEATNSSKPKDKLTIEVLNGSGIAGQAGKVKGILEDLGYQNIETGNAEGTSTKETAVTYSKNVSSKQRDEITKKLESTFEKVTTQEASSESEFDIIITTGSYAES